MGLETNKEVLEELKEVDPALEKRLKFIARNSVYGINPKSPTTEQLIAAGVFTTTRFKESN